MAFFHVGNNVVNEDKATPPAKAVPKVPTFWGSLGSDLAKGAKAVEEKVVSTVNPFSPENVTAAQKLSEEAKTGKIGPQFKTLAAGMVMGGEGEEAGIIKGPTTALEKSAIKAPSLLEKSKAFLEDRLKTPKAVADEAKSTIIPERMTAGAQKSADVLREAKSKLANARTVEGMQGKAANKMFSGYGEEANIANMSNYERTGQFSKAPAGYSEHFKKTTDAAHKLLKQTYGGDRAGYVENYIRHAFTFGSPEDEAKGTSALYDLTKSLSASKAPLRERALDVPMDEALAQMRNKGINVKLAETNPEALRQWTINNARQAAEYKHVWDTLKDADQVRFTPVGAKPAEGMVPLDDKVARVFSRGEVELQEAYDKQVRDSLEKTMDNLGLKHVRKPSIGGPKGSLGWVRKGEPRVVTKFAGPDSVIAHEIGHQIGFENKLSSKLVNNPTFKEELQRVADLRIVGGKDPSFLKYIRKPEEKIATMFEAYVHAPEQLQKFAPNTFKFVEDLIEKDSRLAPLKEAKPSLMLATGSAMKSLGGPIYRGAYYAEPGTARILNNAISKGFENSALFRSARLGSNMMNQFQLGVSALHFTASAINAGVSDMARGLGSLGRSIAKGDVKGALQGAKQTGLSLVPFNSFYKDILHGNSILKGLEQSSPEAVAVLKDVLNPAGARLQQDAMWRTDALTNFRKAAENSDFVKMTGGAIPAVLESLSKPLMEGAIPRVKVGAFLDLAHDVLARLPETASPAVKQRALSEAWNSIDNRFGQLVYDNLFWNKLTKDVAMMSTRSLGWNLGTLRELGGGILDLAHGKVTDRALYTISLPIYVGTFGAVYQYLHTGKGPSELLDYFAPKNGLKDLNGNDARVMLPTYMKDVVSYSKHPLQTVINKMSPGANLFMALIQNKNYLGDMIRNPGDPALKQVEQMGAYAMSNLLPFSLTQSQRAQQEGAPAWQQAESYFGVTQAPAAIEDTKSSELLKSKLFKRGPRTPEQSDVATLKATARRELKQGKSDALQQLISQGVLKDQNSINTFLKSAQETPYEAEVKSLPIADRAGYVLSRYKELENKPDEQTKFLTEMFATGVMTKTVMDQMISQVKTQ